MRLSDPASPYAGPPERLPADPPPEVECPTCEREWTPARGDEDPQCPACGFWRRMFHADEDEAVRMVRELEDDLAIAKGTP